MRKSSASLRDSGTYTSPGTPEYGDSSVGGTPKGWSSERVPLPTNSSRRHINSPALMPFFSGRALPSKWDDAERWITSPVSAYGVCKNSTAQPRRPKSKSGPLGVPGLMYLPNYSPPMAALEAGSVKNSMANSPFTTGVLVPDGISLQHAHTTGGRSRRVLPDMLSESSIPSSQDGKPDEAKQTEIAVSRRDMATQMSPDGSSYSSPGRRSSHSSFPISLPSAKEKHHDLSSKVEVRDVQVDKGTAVRRQLKKNGTRKTKRGVPDVQISAPRWDVTQAAKDTSKLQREEAKIAAWENLQKAKAEAAIRKLEMKLEKKRSKSMDKILSKLRVAEMKAQEMRNSLEGSHAHPTSTKKAVFGRKYDVRTGSLRACFSCRTH